jgi:hypothetical protein
LGKTCLRHVKIRVVLDLALTFLPRVETGGRVEKEIKDIEGFMMQMYNRERIA